MVLQTRTIEERVDFVPRATPSTRQCVVVENKSDGMGPSAATDNDEGKGSGTKEVGVGSTGSAKSQENDPPYSEWWLGVVVANTMRATMARSSSVRCTRAVVVNGTSCAWELWSPRGQRFLNRAFESSFGASCCDSWFVVTDRWKNQTMVPPRCASRPTY
jgi:hypothetical protein